MRLNNIFRPHSPGPKPTEYVLPPISPVEPLTIHFVRPEFAESPLPSPSLTDHDDAHHHQNDATTAENPPQWLTDTRLTIVSLLLSTSMFLIMLDSSIISTAIPRITDTFHSLPDVGWYASIYQLSSAALQPLSGCLFHRFRNKPLFLLFLFLFQLGTLLCAAAASSPMLIVGRAVAGLGSAGLVTGGLTIIAASAPVHRRAGLVAVVMGFAQLGLALGPLLGGVLTGLVSWRWVFWIQLPVGGLLALGVALAEVPEQCAKPEARVVSKKGLVRELDLLGLMLLAPAAVMLLLALQFGGGRYGWGEPTVVGLMVGSVLTGLVWAAWNWWKGDEALMPVSLIKVRAVWTGAVTHLCIMTGVFCASFFLPIYFQAVKGMTPMTSGVSVLASVLSQFVALPVAGKLVELTGYVVPFALFSAITGAVSNGLYSTLQPATPTARWIGYQILNGFGRGVGMPMAVLAVQAALPPTDVAMGNSIIMFVQTFGTAITLAASDAIFEASLTQELRLKAPGVDAETVIAAGGTHFREIADASDLVGVVAAYATSVGRVFYLAATASAVAAVSCLGLGWVDMRKKDAPREEDGVPLGEVEA